MKPAVAMRMPASATRDRSIVRFPAFAATMAVVPAFAAVVMMPIPRWAACVHALQPCCRGTVNQSAVLGRWYDGGHWSPALPISADEVGSIGLDRERSRATFIFSRDEGTRS